MAVNALEALVKLQADMPGWLEKAEALRCAAHTRYNAFTKLSESMVGPPSLRRRVGSVESLRPQDDGEEIPLANVTPPLESNTLPVPVSLQPVQSTVPTTVPMAGKINIDPRNRHLFREVREQRRKRKNPSLRDGNSGPQKQRFRTKLTIYYDSGIQDGFHSLVQSISGARNTLRKARTSASLRPKLLSMQEEESPWGPQGAYAYRMSNAHRLDSTLGGIFDGQSPLEVYTQLDRDLEAAQTLCEVGSHQALRDGDCFEELEDVKAHFKRCMQSIDGEIVNLRETDKALSALQNGADSEHFMVIDDPQSSRKASVFEGDDPSGIAVDGPIEVDEEDAASIIIDLSKLPGRHQYSSKLHSQTRASSSSEMKAAQVSTPQTNVSLVMPAPAIWVEKEDLLTKYTGSGMDVPLDQAQALAAFIAVDNDEPDLDLDALRNSVPRRHQENSTSPSPAPEHVPTDPDFDMAAMRQAALKSRNAPAIAPELKATAGTDIDSANKEPEIDMEAMKKQALARRRDPVASTFHNTNFDASATLRVADVERRETDPVYPQSADYLRADQLAATPVTTSDEVSPLAPDSEPEFDFAAMRKSALKKRTARNSPGAAITSASKPPSSSGDTYSDLPVDSKFPESQTQMDEKQSLMLDQARSLHGSPRAQAV